MALPSCFLPQPAAHWDENTLADFERLYEMMLIQEAGATIDYTLSAPKWQFLCYLCDRKNVVLHGSGDTQITELAPRKANDVNAFGDRQAIYAASDGIWAMFFAVVDRERYVTSLVNSCCRVVKAEGTSAPYYFFSVNGDALSHNPWRLGVVYALPGATFEPQPRQWYRGLEIEPAQWASLEAVKPLAKLSVGPEDFPFLAQISPHDPVTLRARAQADPEGFPWLDEMEEATREKASETRR